MQISSGGRTQSMIYLPRLTPVPGSMVSIEYYKEGYTLAMPQKWPRHCRVPICLQFVFSTPKRNRVSSCKERSDSKLPSTLPSEIITSVENAFVHSNKDIDLDNVALLT